MSDFRLGDVLDDYCVKCRRITNHSIVSIVNDEAAKVRCRTCYHDHDYRHEIAPPTKKELKQQELMAAMLAAGGQPEAGAEASADAGAEVTAEDAPKEAAPAKKAARSKK